MTLLFLSCEHGGNKVPKALQPCFAGQEEVLHTHRGLDIGALDLFRHLVPLADESTYATRSRLCIELNRSAHHPRLFSAYTKALPPAQKEALLQFHHAYRQAFTERIRARVQAGHHVVHVAVHSFTPVLDGAVRTMDIGLLYDPARPREKHFCHTWRRALERRIPGLTVRMNQPYKGTSDGFPTALRGLFPRHYTGIELEVNQRFAPQGRMNPALVRALHGSLEETLPAR